MLKAFLIKNGYRMNILYVAQYSGWNGADQSLFDMIGAMKGMLNPVVVVPKYGVFTNKLQNKGMKYYVIPYYCRYSKRETDIVWKEQELLISTVNAAYKMISIIKDESIDIVRSI